MANAFDVSNKSLGDLSLDELVYIHVRSQNNVTTKDHFVISSLEQIESSMRSANGRTNSQFYGPAMCAFAILDQVGSCYSRKSASRVQNQTPNLIRTLHNFCNIPATSDEARYLYAFRNAQVHDASYTGHNLQKTRWYMFRHDESLGSVIRLPRLEWDGSAATMGADTTALISRKYLIELASSAVRAVDSLFQTDRADLDVRISSVHLLHKYLLWIPK